jgi:hypothetical protein
MAKTLLNGTNAVLEMLGMVHGDNALLTSLTDSARQRVINLCIKAWNEAMIELYSRAQLPLPQVLGEDTITLVTDDRDYALATDLNILYFPLLDETNGQYISEWKSGYLGIVNSQPFPSNEIGLPYYGAIRPTDGQLYLDKIPTSTENGRIYKYRYQKDISVSVYTDTFPFADIVYTALLPAVSEIVRRDYRRSFDEGTFNHAMGKAAGYLRKKPQRDSYLPSGYRINPTDPFENA